MEETQTNLNDDFTDEDKVESEGNFHNFKNNPVVIGILDRFENSRHGETPILRIGEVEVIIGNYTALVGKLTPDDIGKKIKIQYLGEQKSGTGRIYMEFGVWKKSI